MTDPFLKWAGGKRWLANAGLLPLPTGSTRHIEPFIGGGAVFFRLAPETAVIADLNEDLIELYRVMRDDPKILKERMIQHQADHDDIYYYLVRDQSPDTPLERAARFLYLNRTCWNGLYRVNRFGKFNVPRGTKDSVLF